LSERPHRCRGPPNVTHPRVTAFSGRVTLLRLRVTLFMLRVTPFALRVTPVQFRVTLLRLRVTLFHVRVTLLTLGVTVFWVRVTVLGGVRERRGDGKPGRSGVRLGAATHDAVRVHRGGPRRRSTASTGHSRNTARRRPGAPKTPFRAVIA